MNYMLVYFIIISDILWFIIVYLDSIILHLYQHGSDRPWKLHFVMNWDCMIFKLPWFYIHILWCFDSIHCDLWVLFSCLAICCKLKLCDLISPSQFHDHAFPRLCLSPFKNCDQWSIPQSYILMIIPLWCHDLWILTCTLWIYFIMLKWMILSVILRHFILYEIDYYQILLP